MMSGSSEFKFGEILRHYRVRARMTQAELGDNLVVHRNTIGNWETEIIPKRDDILLLKDALSLSWKELDELLIAAGYGPEYTTPHGVLKSPSNNGNTQPAGYLRSVSHTSTLKEIITIEQNSTATIGRQPDCTIVIPIDFVRVSRYHALITAEHGGVYIEDKNSTNGTFVDRKRVFEKTRLNHGEHILLGERVASEGTFVLEFLESPATTK